LLTSLLDFIFPKACLGCGQNQGYLCENCLNYIKTSDVNICPECLRPTASGLTHPNCYQQNQQRLTGLTAVFLYQGIIKKALVKLKTKLITDLSSIILELFLTGIADNKVFTEFMSREKALLVPMPLSWQKKNLQGFNQSELLGKKISQSLGLEYKNLLLEKNNKPDLNKKVFNQKMIKKYSALILFDDLWLDGKKIKQGAKILKQQGFKKIWALVLARS